MYFLFHLYLIFAEYVGLTLFIISEENTVSLCGTNNINTVDKVYDISNKIIIIITIIIEQKRF